MAQLEDVVAEGTDDVEIIDLEAEEEAGSDEVKAAETSTDTAEEEPEAEEAAPDEEAPEADDAEVAPDAEVEASEEQPESSQPETQPEPFSFKVDGKRVEVEGALVIKHDDLEGNPTESIVIPKRSWEKALPHLADRTVLAHKEREFQQRLADLDPERNEHVVRARALVDEFDKILGSEEAFAKFFENFEANAEALRLKVENQAIKQSLQSRQERDETRESQFEAEETERAIENERSVIAENAVRHVAAELGIDLPTDVVQLVQDELADNRDAYYVRADAEIAKTYGVDEGTLVRRDDRVVRMVQRFASLAAKGSKRGAELAQAARKNEAALAPSKPKPKTVPAKGSPAAADEKPITSREEFDKWAGLNV